MADKHLDDIEACPAVAEALLAHLSRVFPDAAPRPQHSHRQMDQMVGEARVTRFLRAAYEYQHTPKDEHGHPLEPDEPQGGLLEDLDQL